ncbi:MAG: capsule biosynthesis protein, partial [Ruegeria sp.]
PQPAAAPQPKPAPANPAPPAAQQQQPKQQQPKPAAPGAPAPQASPAQPVPPVVSRTRPRLRHVAVLFSFLFWVAAPSALGGYYLWGIAADQYASKVGFSVRREEVSSPIELLGGLADLSGSSSSDTDILYEFIQSQKLVSDINAEIDLASMWSTPTQDVLFAYDAEGTIEDLVEYWNRMVRLAYDSGTGLIEVEVRSFAAADSTQIAEKIFEKSTDMINELSSIAQEDAIRYAREELDAAVERLKEARETVTRFRNVNQLVDPSLDLQSQAGLLGSLESQLAEQLIELDLLEGNTSANDPRVTQASRRVEVIQNRIAAERRKLGIATEGEANSAFADLVGEYERLVVDREFAETAYTSALANFDAARAEARRKSRYLAAYLQPTRAEAAVYPERVTLLVLWALFLFLTWSIVTLVLYSLKDRR